MPRSLLLLPAWMPAFMLVASLVAAEPARPYVVLTRDGQEIEVKAIAAVGDAYVLTVPGGQLALDEGEIDFYGTFRTNLDLHGGNVLAFRRGGFLRFEELAFDEGRVTIVLEEGRAFAVGESLVDFRTSVLEGAMLRLPASYGDSVEVAKGAESKRPVRRAGRDSDRRRRTTQTSRSSKR